MNDLVSLGAAERHGFYVELGYCPAIHPGGSWCCQRGGHGGRHFSLRVISEKQFVRGMEWD